MDGLIIRKKIEVEKSTDNFSSEEVFIEIYIVRRKINITSHLK